MYAVNVAKCSMFSDVFSRDIYIPYNLLDMLLLLFCHVFPGLLYYLGDGQFWNLFFDRQFVHKYTH